MPTIARVSRWWELEDALRLHEEEVPVSDGELPRVADDDVTRIKVIPDRRRQTLSQRSQEGDEHPLELGHNVGSSAFSEQDRRGHRIWTIEGYANRLGGP
jgi:hypothetical protein